MFLKDFWDSGEYKKLKNELSTYSSFYEFVQRFFRKYPEYKFLKVKGRNDSSNWQNTFITNTDKFITVVNQKYIKTGRRKNTEPKEILPINTNTFSAKMCIQRGGICQGCYYNTFFESINCQMAEYLGISKENKALNMSNSVV